MNQTKNYYTCKHCNKLIKTQKALDIIGSVRESHSDRYVYTYHKGCWKQYIKYNKCVWDLI